MRWTIGKKLAAGFLFVLLMLTGIGVTGYVSLIRAEAQVVELVSVADDLLRVSEIHAGIIMLQEIPTDYMAVAAPENRTEFAQVKSDVLDNLRVHMGEADLPGEREAWSQVEGRLIALINAAETALALENPVGHPSGLQLMEHLDERTLETLEAVEAVEAIVKAASLAAQEQTGSLVDTALLILVALTAAALLVGTLASVLISRNITSGVRQVSDALRALAAGDLAERDLRATTRDEVGEMVGHFNQMTRDLRSFVAGVQASAGGLLRAAGELAGSAERSEAETGKTGTEVGRVAETARQQVEAAERMRATMSQLQEAIGQIAAGAQQTAGEVQSASGLLAGMASEIDRVTKGAHELARSADEAAAVARSGAEVVERTVAGMARIKAAVGRSAAGIQQLEDLSRQIGQITDAISGIAEQTNLLALNAAIEAARAGEHGRGFAVVAEEVRRLAERAAASTKEITGLVERIQSSTGTAVTAMEQGTGEVESGNRLASETGEAFQRILAAVQQSAAEMRQIAGASEQMRDRAQQVVRAFDGVAAVTEENTAATEEMSAGSSEVTHTAEDLSARAAGNAGTAQAVSASVQALRQAGQEVSRSSETVAQTAHDLEQQVSRFRL